MHVERDASTAKFWLDPVRLQESGGFGRADLNRLQALVTRHRNYLPETWNEYFSD